MNQRIKELAEQAGDDWDHTLEEDRKFLEKFAQLIVRECADICNKIYFERYPDAEDFERSEEGDAIKKHFGVEESVKAELKHKCSVCGTTENVKWVGGHQPYLCDSPDCIPF